MSDRRSSTLYDVAEKQNRTADSIVSEIDAISQTSSLSAAHHDSVVMGFSQVRSALRRARAKASGTQV